MLLYDVFIRQIVNERVPGIVLRAGCTLISKTRSSPSRSLQSNMMQGSPPSSIKPSVKSSEFITSQRWMKESAGTGLKGVVISGLPREFSYIWIILESPSTKHRDWQS